MKRVWLGIGMSAWLALPASAVGGDNKRELPGGGENPRCEAQCRQLHQGNAAALQACLRDCGAIEPAGARAAPPAGTAGAGVAAQAEASNLNLSKSNVSDRTSGNDNPSNPQDDGD